ncbi:MAG TPA: ERF family protein [Polyangiaceae bacterium]|nr:ERF family protein [Polyangiaceae bacterium]
MHEERPIYPPALAAAILQAQRTVKEALKTSTNSYHNYKYASAEEVLIVGREALNDACLSMIPVSEDFEPLAQIDDRCGGAVATVRCKYAIIHESGASTFFSTDVPVVPEKGRSSGWSRPADKATFGARTEALGYALRDFLLIPRKDAPDVSGRRDGDRTGPGPAPEQPPRDQRPVMSLEEAKRGIREAKKISDIVKALGPARRDRPFEEHPELDEVFAEKIVAACGAVENADQLSRIDGFVARVGVTHAPAAAAIQEAIKSAKERVK